MEYPTPFFREAGAGTGVVCLLTHPDVVNDALLRFLQRG
jgi:hypothetical protein